MNRSTIFLALLLLGSRVYGWSPIDTVVARECRQTGVPFAVAERLIASESSWNPKAVNPNDPSVGLAQLQTHLLPWFAHEFNGGKSVDPWDPVVSVVVMIRYLAWLYARTGTWYWTALAYKSGLYTVTSTSPWGTAVPLQTREISWKVATGGTDERH